MTAPWTMDSTTVHMDSTRYTMDGGTLVPWASVMTAQASASATFTTLAQVTLIEPLYRGLGGALDWYLWNVPTPGPLPAGGTVVYYDPTSITVNPDATITATSANASGVIQFFAGAFGLRTAIVEFTPGLVAFGLAQASAGGTISPAVPKQFQATSQAIAEVIASLTAGIPLAANSASVATVTATLTAAARMAAALQGQAAATAALTTGVTFVSQLLARGAVLASMTTGIPIAGRGAAVATVAGTLTTGKPLKAQLFGRATVTASMHSLSAQLASNLLARAAVRASLTNGPRMAASLLGDATVRASFTVPKPLSARLSGTATVTAAVRTGSGFKVTARGLASVVANLHTSVLFSTDAAAVATVTASLITYPKYTMPILVSHQVPGRFQPSEFPVGQFDIGAGTESVYAIDWAYWISNLWQPGAVVAANYVVRPFPYTGYQYVCTTAGQTGDYQPVWPISVGGVVGDGSANWTAQAIDNTSLQSTLVLAEWTSDDPAIAVTSYSVNGTLAPVGVDASAATAGVSYTITCQAQFADGDFLIGKIILDVT